MSEQVPAEKKSTAHECDRCGRRWHGGHDHCCACHEVELADLRASLAREENARQLAVKDAERYRWLKRQAEVVFFKDYQWVQADDRKIHVKQINPVDLDATIDAAMEKNS